MIGIGRNHFNPVHPSEQFRCKRLNSEKEVIGSPQVFISPSYDSLAEEDELLRDEGEILGHPSRRGGGRSRNRLEPCLRGVDRHKESEVVQSIEGVNWYLKV